MDRLAEIAVVGAGMGGLAAALRLAHKGHRVTIFEKTGMVGGRNRPVRVNGCEFDGGPTLLMMREPFDRLFRDVGEDLQDHLDLSLLDPSYRVFFGDGSRLDASPDPSRMTQTIQFLFGAQEASGFKRLLSDLEAMYAEAIPRFVRRNFDRPANFISPSAIASAVRHRMLSNWSRRLVRYVKDPKLPMLFSFQSMYLGLSPFEAPWVYAVLTRMEYAEGIWYVHGGLIRLAEAIANLATARGVQIRVNSPVRRIEGNQLVLESGESFKADSIVVNADLPYAERELMGAKPKERKFSCSAYVMYIDYHGQLPQLLHHNVFFGSDFRRNLEQIFTRKQIPDDPAFYAAISARSDPSKAPDGHENLMLLVPCPNLERNWSESDLCVLKARVFSRLSNEVGFDPERAAGFDSFDPRRYASELNLDKGAAFGLSHCLFQSAAFRPSNQSRLNSNVFFVGASTLPGNGLPMVLISAELVQERIEKRGKLAHV